MSKYIYNGPVMLFGRCIQDNWHAETMAVSKGKALSNFRYQFNKYYNHIPSTKIELPGEITVC